MKGLFENIKLTLYFFSVITLVSTIVTACYITVFYGRDAELTVDILWQILIVSFFCSICPIFFSYHGDWGLGSRPFLIRSILEYIYINVVVLGFGCWFAWFDISNFSMVIGMMFFILLAFVVITGYVFWADFRTSEQINRKLRERNGNGEDL